MRHIWSGALLAAGLALAGCGNPPAPNQGTVTTASSSQGPTAGPKRYAATELPPVGERMLPLDDGRVDFAPPEGWRVLLRNPKYLARFVKGNLDNSLPRITVSGMPAPEAVGDVTAENADEFAVQMQQRCDAVPGRRMLEPCRPILLGDYAWSRHVRYVSADRKPAVVQSLETARGGRLYSIELIVASEGETNDDFAKAILAHRDSAYAVAANWRFVGEAAERASEQLASETGQESETDRENPATDGPPQE